MNLQNATGLITGGTRGIGYAIAEMLTSAGARVANTGRDERLLEQARTALGVLAIRADVSREEDVRRTLGTVLDEFGALDILVNNAGIGVFKPSSKMTVYSKELP